MAEWPDWLPGLIRLPDDQYIAGKLKGLKNPPTGIVIHSGSRAEWLAEWITRNRYSYHFAWSKSQQAIVQTVPLTHRAQHAGAAGNHWIGIGLSGPWNQDPRRDVERYEFRRVVGILASAMPSLAHWCRHSDIEPKKRDPGPGFSGDWLDGTGLTWRLA